MSTSHHYFVKRGTISHASASHGEQMPFGCLEAISFVLGFWLGLHQPEASMLGVQYVSNQV